MTAHDSSDEAPISIAEPPRPPVDDRRGRRPHVVVFIVPALVAGAVLGFLAGTRFGSERVKDEYRNPLVVVKPPPSSGATVVASGSPSADPSPAPGTKVIAPFPLAGARKALSLLTSQDKVVVTVGSVGRSEDGMELHLALANRGDCTLKTVSGVAYGFDPDGDATAMNADGKHYVAFSSDDLSVAAGDTAIANYKVRHPKLANVVIAQIDKAVCDNGKVLVTRLFRPAQCAFAAQMGHGVRRLSLVPTGGSANGRIRPSASFAQHPLSRASSRGKP